jgi:four helix bundle protein
MPERRSYFDLIAWQKAMELVAQIYRVTKNWPREETFGLTSQLRRAAVSIPSNVAEGHGRTGPREFVHHLSIAHGSLCEAETQLLIARHLEYIDDSVLERLMQQTSEVGRLTRGIIRSLRWSVLPPAVCRSRRKPWPTSISNP